MGRFTFGTIFAGGGVADCGFIAAGGEPILAIENDITVAEVYADNFSDKHLLPFGVERISDRIWRSVEGLDLLHMSPPCPRFSVANKDRGETEEDIVLAKACANAIRLSRPRFVSIENVYGYRKSESFRILTDTLTDLEYDWDHEHINAADFAVPQTRKRLILRASREGDVPPLIPTHKGNWQGWYQAIEDLIPTLQETRLADWQIRRLKDTPLGDFLCNGIPDNHAGKFTVTAKENCLAPAPVRAVLVEGYVAGERPPRLLPPMDPAPTVACTGGGRVHRIALLDAIESGMAKVVTVSPRCLARFQSMPDSYRLPAKKTLAGKIIGNGLPSLLAQRIAESLL